MMGIYYRNLLISPIGKFNSYALAETDNQYDSYAIAIYKDSGEHIGYLPKNNKKVHTYILQEGGKVHAYGYLANGKTWYGDVCVETDKESVTKRNKKYIVNE